MLNFQKKSFNSSLNHIWMHHCRSHCSFFLVLCHFCLVPVGNPWNSPNPSKSGLVRISRDYSFGWLLIPQLSPNSYFYLFIVTLMHWNVIWKWRYLWWADCLLFSRKLLLNVITDFIVISAFRDCINGSYSIKLSS